MGVPPRPGLQRHRPERFREHRKPVQPDGRRGSGFSWTTLGRPGRGRRERDDLRTNMDWNFLLFTAIKIVCVLVPVLTMVAYAVLAERKITAWIQDRVGPNRAAPPIALKIPVI